MDKLDPEGFITHRLYRDHTSKKVDKLTGETLCFVKDLSRLGRDTRKVVIIDNLKENFSRQPSNGIQITTWKEDPFDTELLYLQNLLLNMVKQSPENVCDFLDMSKEHGLLPKHFLETSLRSSGSFTAFDTFTAKCASNNVGASYLASTPGSKFKETYANDTVQESPSSSGMKQMAVSNSSFQRRRLSIW